MNKLSTLLLASLALFSCSSNVKKDVEIHSYEDLTGHNVAVIAGSCYEMDLSGRKDISLQIYNAESDALSALVNGMADVFVYDETIFDAQIRRENGIKISGYGDKGFPTSFMFQKGETELIDACNRVFDRMKKDGSMDELKEYWLKDKYLEDKSFLTKPRPELSGEPIKVGCSSTTAPLGFTIEDDWYGIEIDLAYAMAQEAGRSIEIKYYNPASSIMALKTGMADVLIGCVFITEERKQTFAFADSYHDYHGAFFVKDHNAKAQHQGFFKRLKDNFVQNLIEENRWKYITSGLLETLKITFFAILLGSLLGIFIYMMTISRSIAIRKTADFYKWLISGIPELVLLLIMFYVVFAKSGLNPTAVAIVAFAMNFSAGASDIYGSSLRAIPYGQTEAGLALGFTKTQTFTHIVLPQALKYGLPMFKGQCIALLKGTSIVGYVSIQDLTRAGDIIRSRTFDAFMPLLIITVIYFVLAWLIGLLLNTALPKKKVL